MQFSLEHGETASFITKMAKRMGQDLSHTLTAPELPQGLQVYFDAFFVLGSERIMSQGVCNRIPWSKIVQYAEYHNFSKRQSDYLLYFVGKLDDCYIAHFYQKLDNARKKT